jgi:DNA repair exonuclease SbcCD nuclease subunit
MMTHLSNIQAKERREELLLNFKRLYAYAKAQNVTAILMAGDLFDTQWIRPTTRNVLLQEIESHPQISFFYLRGNHDGNNTLYQFQEKPVHFHTFEDTWTTYTLGDFVCVTGIEVTQENEMSRYETLQLDHEKLNLVMLHGQVVTHGTGAEQICLERLKGKGIDYLALGHVHARQEGMLDARGAYVYPGCLEGRGFDEAGERGFYLLDVEEEKRQVSYSFVPFATRMFHTIYVDVTGCENSVEIERVIQEQLEREEIAERDFVKVILQGELSVDVEKNLTYLMKCFQSYYAVFRMVDETQLQVNLQEYENEISLKGEFVRTVFANEKEKDEEKQAIIRYGLQLLNGDKDVEL